MTPADEPRGAHLLGRRRSGDDVKAWCVYSTDPATPRLRTVLDASAPDGTIELREEELGQSGNVAEVYERLVLDAATARWLFTQLSVVMARRDEVPDREVKRYLNQTSPKRRRRKKPSPDGEMVVCT